MFDVNFNIIFQKNSWSENLSFFQLKMWPKPRFIGIVYVYEFPQKCFIFESDKFTESWFEIVWVIKILYLYNMCEYLKKLSPASCFVLTPTKRNELKCSNNNSLSKFFIRKNDNSFILINIKINLSLICTQMEK